MAANPSPILQLERAWHALMRTMGIKHPGKVMAGQAVVRVLHQRMKGR